jgi:transcriptional regulator with XRE-family HTH domain
MGARIRAARKSTGLSALHFAQQLGKHPSQLSRWETGGSTPVPEMIVTIANATGVDLAWLMTGEGDGPPVDDAGDAAA